MKNWFKTFVATCAVIPFAQCAVLPGGNIARAAEPVAAVATTDADPALWVVKDKDTTIYLFGTVHVLKPGLGWFDEAVKTAFDKSDQLMLEMILPEDQAAVAQTMVELGINLGSVRAARNLKHALRESLAFAGQKPTLSSLMGARRGGAKGNERRAEQAFPQSGPEAAFDPSGTGPMNTTQLQLSARKETST